MSTFVDLLPQTFDDVCEPAVAAEPEEYSQPLPAVWAAIYTVESKTSPG